jgi:hypothetical protein
VPDTDGASVKRRRHFYWETGCRLVTAIDFSLFAMRFRRMGNYCADANYKTLLSRSLTGKQLRFSMAAIPFAGRQTHHALSSMCLKGHAELAAWPAYMQKAVRYGRALAGMTPDQVLMSLGYPSRADTPDLNAESWRYRTAPEEQPVDLYFGKDQKLASLSGKPSAVRQIEAIR